MSTTKLRTVSVVDAVAEKLGEEIFDGTFQPGDILVESQLAARYQVPRQTVRSAIVVLIHDGILCREPNKSVYVPQFSEVDLRDLFAVRRLLEMEAARILAARKIIPKDAESAVRFMEILCEENDWNEVLKLDFKFHQALIEATGSPRLQRFYRSISAEKRLALCYYRSADSSPRVIAQEHRELLDALRTGDPDTAAEASRLHIEESETFINRTIQTQRDSQTTCRNNQKSGKQSKL